MNAIHHVDVTGDGDDHIRFRRGSGERHDTEAIHRGFERARGIDLRHDHVCAEP